MKKESFIGRIVVAFIFCIFLSTTTVNARGVSYGGEIRIGLVNMAAKAMDITFLYLSIIGNLIFKIAYLKLFK